MPGLHKVLNMPEYASIIPGYNFIRQNLVNFLVYGQGSKKIGSVGRQNENNVIWFLGLAFFKK